MLSSSNLHSILIKTHRLIKLETEFVYILHYCHTVLIVHESFYNIPTNKHVSFFANIWVTVLSENKAINKIY